ncbi:hypothetical protein BC830DRAFT_86162 [Chytriomyces sp. MP71]|nr:hypothetical protein BC830DRAFT_86162 [Chytriomyces sp. MP71]
MYPYPPPLPRYYAASPREFAYQAPNPPTGRSRTQHPAPPIPPHPHPHWGHPYSIPPYGFEGYVYWPEPEFPGPAYHPATMHPAALHQPHIPASRHLNRPTPNQTFPHQPGHQPTPSKRVVVPPSSSTPVAAVKRTLRPPQIIAQSVSLRSSQLPSPISPLAPARAPATSTTSTTAATAKKKYRCSFSTRKDMHAARRAQQKKITAFRKQADAKPAGASVGNSGLDAKSEIHRRLLIKLGRKAEGMALSGTEHDEEEEGEVEEDEEQEEDVRAEGEAGEEEGAVEEPVSMIVDQATSASPIHFLQPAYLPHFGHTTPNPSSSYTHPPPLSLFTHTTGEVLLPQIQLPTGPESMPSDSLPPLGTQFRQNSPYIHHAHMQPTLQSNNTNPLWAGGLRPHHDAVKIISRSNSSISIGALVERDVVGEEGSVFGLQAL